jgi:hypothetical protein
MRVARWIGFSLAGLLVLLLAADRLGVYVAERAAADSLKSSQHLSSTPDVSIAGFPFLTQLAAGDYPRITVTAKGVPVGPPVHTLVLSRLKVVLHRLSVSHDFHTFRADTASAVAAVDFDQLGSTLRADLSYAGNGRIRATKTVALAGRSFRATVTARPELVNGALAFTDASVADAGTLGRTLRASLSRLFSLHIPLQNVPFDVRVDSLAVTADGVTIDLSGRDLVYLR